jgi:hypothetical protein
MKAPDPPLAISEDRPPKTTAVQMEIWGIPQVSSAASGTPGTLFRLSVPLQFHNSAAQQMTVHSVSARVIDRSSRQAMDKIKNIGSAIFLNNSRQEVDLTNGILVPAGSSSSRYWLSVSLLVPANLPLGEQHVAEITMKAMLQDDKSVLIACAWEPGQPLVRR